MVRLVFGAMLLFLAGCGSESPRKSAEAPPPPPPDESRYFPIADQTATRVVAEHILGPSLSPGGTEADYKAGKRSYKLLLIKFPTREKAAFFLLDIRNLLTAPKYLPNMGGYFGARDGTPWYVFAKNEHVACVQGLALDGADPVARTFAARVP